MEGKERRSLLISVDRLRHSTQRFPLSDKYHINVRRVCEAEIVEKETNQYKFESKCGLT